MTIFQAIILGIVQGLTEFLPVSSSAHLVLVPHFLGWQIPEAFVFPFDVLVQIGTLVAVVVYYWRDLIDIARGFLAGLTNRGLRSTQSFRLGVYILIGTLPAGFAGLLIKDLVEHAFNSPAITAGFLVVTAILLLGSEQIGRRNRSLSHMQWLDALLIGIGQALAIFPGVSRSGATISSGLARNFDRKSAARFSFLLSIPIFIAAGALSITDLFDLPDLASFLPALLAGFVTSAIVGYLSIKWLLGYVSRHSLRAFAYYCLGLAAITFIFLNVIK